MSRQVALYIKPAAKLQVGERILSPNMTVVEIIKVEATSYGWNQKGVIVTIIYNGTFSHCLIFRENDEVITIE